MSEKSKKVDEIIDETVKSAVTIEVSETKNEIAKEIEGTKKINDNVDVDVDVVDVNVNSTTADADTNVDTNNEDVVAAGDVGDVGDGGDEDETETETAGDVGDGGDEDETETETAGDVGDVGDVGDGGDEDETETETAELVGEIKTKEDLLNYLRQNSDAFISFGIIPDNFIDKNKMDILGFASVLNAVGCSTIEHFKVRDALKFIVPPITKPNTSVDVNKSNSEEK